MSPDEIDPLSEYILSRLRQGIPRNEVEDELIANGYDPSWVNEITQELDAEVRAALSRQQRRNRAEHLTPLVFLILGGCIFGAGVLLDGNFWMLWLTGARADGEVTGSEVVIYSWSVSRRGKAYPETSTVIYYSFQGPNALKATGNYTLPGSNPDWKAGTPLGVMHSRFDATNNQPSSFMFNYQHDPILLYSIVMMLIGTCFAGVSSWCLWRLIRSQRGRPLRLASPGWQCEK